MANGDGDQRDIAKHVRIVAGLTGAIGVIHVILLAVMLWVTGLATGARPVGEAVVWTEPYGLALLLIGGIAILALVAGHGLWRRQAWARTPTMVLAGISLLSIPIGTAYGIYTLWVLTREGVRAVLEPA
ncbi:MAG: hypothetical protein R3185_06255 [Candidatus Thermoplasmatota archaeon]|nr:hypothetical protein [Candidatus Thermoplasmatota archaeon]